MIVFRYVDDSPIDFLSVNYFPWEFSYSVYVFNSDCGDCIKFVSNYNHYTPIYILFVFKSSDGDSFINPYYKDYKKYIRVVDGKHFNDSMLKFNLENIRTTDHYKLFNLKSAGYECILKDGPYLRDIESFNSEMCKIEKEVFYRASKVRHRWYDNRE